MLFYVYIWSLHYLIYIHTINLKIYDSVDIWYLIVDIQWIDWLSSNNVILILIRYRSPCSVNLNLLVMFCIDIIWYMCIYLIFNIYAKCHMLLKFAIEYLDDIEVRCLIFICAGVVPSSFYLMIMRLCHLSLFWIVLFSMHSIFYYTQLYIFGDVIYYLMLSYEITVISYWFVLDNIYSCPDQKSVRSLADWLQIVFLHQIHIYWWLI
jgi:hypothetical protein